MAESARSSITDWSNADPALDWNLRLDPGEIDDLGALESRPDPRSSRVDHLEPPPSIVHDDEAPDLFIDLGSEEPDDPDDPDFSLRFVSADEALSRSPRSVVPRPRREESNTGRTPRYPEIGQVVTGFRIVRELGRGAFARVYLAEQLGLASRLVALKMATQAIGEESQLLARLQHAHIVPIHSVHEDPATGLHLLCMPYLGGANLAQVLEAAGKEPKQRSHHDTGCSLVEALDLIGGPLPAIRRRAPKPDSPDAPPGPANAPESFRRDDVEPGKASSRGSGSASRMRSRLDRYWQRIAGKSRFDDAEESEDLEGDHARPARRFLRHASFVQAAAWIAARLAEGLDHAHERHLLHRDLKPSNILITADGTPMILDFNLSADAELRDPSIRCSRARVGGTLPYMAPEHLDAFHPDGSTHPEEVDERSDLYALGLILFEMVAGRHPFREPPDGLPMVEVLDRMIAERRQGAPSARAINPEVPWSLDSILRTCLHPDPKRRYRTADAMAEDLRRFLEDQPLRHAPEPSLREQMSKFLRRNPRLASSTAVAFCASILLLIIGGLLGLVGRNLQEAAAQLQRRDFESTFARCQLLLNTSIDHDTSATRTGQLDQGIALARDVLDSYEIDDLGASWVNGPMVRVLPPEERRSLIEEVSELVQLEARATVLRARDGPELVYAAALERAMNRLTLAERFDPAPPSTLFADRAHYAAALGLADQAEADRQRARETPPTTARDYYLLGTAALASGRPDEAEAHLDHAVGLAPRRFWSWFALGLCHFDQARYDVAAADFSVCAILQPDSAWAFANRGLALALSGRLTEALRAYDRAVAIAPDLLEARRNRALTLLELGRPGEAAEDLRSAIEHGGRRDPDLLAAWGEALARAGRRDEAERRFAEALANRPGDPPILIARGFVRLDSNPSGARLDFKHALSLVPDDPRAHLGLAHLLRRDDPHAALDHLDAALSSRPGFSDALQLRALVRAELGMRSALADVDALQNPPTPHRLYNAACALTLLSRTSDDPALIDNALVLLRRALDAGFPVSIARNDPDLATLRDRPEFLHMIRGG